MYWEMYQEEWGMLLLWKLLILYVCQVNWGFLLSFVAFICLKSENIAALILHLLDTLVKDALSPTTFVDAASLAHENLKVALLLSHYLFPLESCSEPISSLFPQYSNWFLVRQIMSNWSNINACSRRNLFWKNPVLQHQKKVLNIFLIVFLLWYIQNVLTILR